MSNPETHKTSGAPLSRRRFLQTSTLAAGAAALGAPALLRAAGAGQKLNVAFIGLGGMGRGRLNEILSCDVAVTAFCDVDERQFDEAKKVIAGHPFTPRLYLDYRELLEKETNLDAVVIAPPDHWHAPITQAALQAGKHIFCEKPLTHTISEAREIRSLARKSKVITQMGNQGSASNELRRGIELIQAGALGSIRNIYTWTTGAGCHPGLAMPTVGDPVPSGLHWDAWLGPAPSRLYKNGYYHPWNWRGWFDFGNGVVADFGCHNLNLAFRALKLGYPNRLQADGEFMGLPTYPGRTRVIFDFAPRGELPPATIWWYDGGRTPPPEVIPSALTEHFGGLPDNGVLFIGEKGFLFGDAWKNSEYVLLNGEKRMSGILQHAATKDVPQSLPRSPGHLKEWVLACTGGPPVFSDFETGGHLTEIALSGVLPLRTGRIVDWDGEAMRSANVPEAERYVQARYREGWKI